MELIWDFMDSDGSTVAIGTPDTFKRDFGTDEPEAIKKAIRRDPDMGVTGPISRLDWYEI